MKPSFGHQTVAHGGRPRFRQLLVECLRTLGIRVAIDPDSHVGIRPEHSDVFAETHGVLDLDGLTVHGELQEGGGRQGRPIEALRIREDSRMTEIHQGSIEWVLGDLAKRGKPCL